MRDNISTPARGETWYQGGTIDTDNLAAVEREGDTKIFEDVDWSNTAGVKPHRSGRKVVCRLVRNMSGITLYGKRLVTLDPTNPGRVTGFADTTAEECYPTDEFLPAAGVPNGDLFWIVISGPAVVLTPMTGAEFGATSIVAGDRIISLTTSGASTAAGTTGVPGRAAGFVFVASTTIAQMTDLVNLATNHVGRAMSAKTSGQTNSDLLIDVKRGGGGYP
jgi:hypothetical protein